MVEQQTTYFCKFWFQFKFPHLCLRTIYVCNVICVILSYYYYCLNTKYNIVFYTSELYLTITKLTLPDNEKYLTYKAYTFNMFKTSSSWSSECTFGISYKYKSPCIKQKVTVFSDVSKSEQKVDLPTYLCCFQIQRVSHAIHKEYETSLCSR